MYDVPIKKVTKVMIIDGTPAPRKHSAVSLILVGLGNHVARTGLRVNKQPLSCRKHVEEEGRIHAFGPPSTVQSAAVCGKKTERSPHRSCACHPPKSSWLSRCLRIAMPILTLCAKRNVETRNMQAPIMRDRARPTSQPDLRALLLQQYQRIPRSADW